MKPIEASLIAAFVLFGIAVPEAHALDTVRVGKAINDIWVCRDGMPHASRDLVDMSAREVVITVDLAAGGASATIWTNDLTADYVHENSAYSS